MNGQKSAIPQEERDIWTDLYKYYATFSTMGNTDADWKRASQAFCYMITKHNDHPLAWHMFMAVFDYLSEQRKDASYQEAVKAAVGGG